MAEGFITRKGGVAATKAPSLNFVSKTDSQIVFTITNNDDATVDVFWELGDNTPDANQLELTAGQTSSNQTLSGLNDNTQYTIFAFANKSNRVSSETVSLIETTDEGPQPYLSFDGVDDYVDLGNDSSLNITSNLTLEFEFSLDNYKSLNQTILDKNLQYYVDILNTENKLRFYGKVIAPNEYLFNFIPQTNTNYFISIVCNTNNNVSLYIDGVFQESISSSGTLEANSSNVNIGRRNFSNSNDNYFGGDIKEFRIWNIARSGTDISNTYNQTLLGSETGLVSYYKFNEGSGTTLNDSAGTNDGTIVGATWGQG